jgi:hypothetical protein
VNTAERMTALDRANETRFYRAEIKRRIARGDYSVSQALMEDSDLLESMRLTELLRAQKGWAITRAEKFMALVKLDPGLTIGDMTTRQRDLVCLFLEVRG